MRKYKCDVQIVEHGSDLTTESTQLADQNLGIIGVACSLQLLEGGWMLKKNGHTSSVCSSKLFWLLSSLARRTSCYKSF